MPQVKKYNSSGNEIGDFELDEKLFNEEINESVIHQVVYSQLASYRKGTSSTKTRSEVNGGGRKPWRQKGTGRARHGSIRSPLWVGGGIVFGPKPRSYNKKVSKKVKKLALRSILSDKVRNEELIIIDEFAFDKPKTKLAVNLLENLDMKDKKVLIILPGKDKNTFLSIRNIPGVKTLLVNHLNAYDLLDNEMIIIKEDALNKVEEVLAG